MLQVKYILENKEHVIEGLQKRNLDAKKLVQQIIDLDIERRSSIAKVEELRAEGNKMSKAIGSLFKEGKIEEANTAKIKVQETKTEQKNLEEGLNKIEEKFQNLLYHIPNVPHKTVPAGSSENDNEEVFKEGSIPNLHEGANLLSFPYIPENNSIDNIFNPISGQLDGIIGEGSAAYFNENINQWVGSLDNISYSKGYWIKVDPDIIAEEIELNVVGFPYQESIISYELHEGYNLISYIGENNFPIEDAIPNQFSNNITSIIGEGVASVYSPELEQWLGNLKSNHIPQSSHYKQY